MCSVAYTLARLENGFITANVLRKRPCMCSANRNKVKTIFAVFARYGKLTLSSIYIFTYIVYLTLWKYIRGALSEQTFEGNGHACVAQIGKK